jgi:hypothetical protein
MYVRYRNFLLVCCTCLTLALAGCGPQDATGQDSGTASDMTESGEAVDSQHEHGSSGGGMTPAYSLSGERRTGTFRALPTPTQQARQMDGMAWVTENSHGTTTTVEVTGLDAGTEYVGHLHARPCSKDQGGPHFAFNPGGPEEPPNEVHFGFTAGDDGSGSATVMSSRRVGSGARSVVVHDASSEDRLVCADLRSDTREPRTQATGGGNRSMHAGGSVTIDVQIRSGEFAPSGDRVEAKVGQPIRLRVDSDQTDEIHVHSTPEHEFAVKPVSHQIFQFTINRPGVYEVEGHSSDTVIVSVAVMP